MDKYWAQARPVTRHKVSQFWDTFLPRQDSPLIQFSPTCLTGLEKKERKEKNTNGRVLISSSFCALCLGSNIFVGVGANALCVTLTEVALILLYAMNRYNKQDAG